jgi:hypothetical protein
MTLGAWQCVESTHCYAPRVMNYDRKVHFYLLHSYDHNYYGACKATSMLLEA